MKNSYITILAFFPICYGLVIPRASNGGSTDVYQEFFNLIQKETEANMKEVMTLAEKETEANAEDFMTTLQKETDANFEQLSQGFKRRRRDAFNIVENDEGSRAEGDGPPGIDSFIPGPIKDQIPVAMGVLNNTEGGTLYLGGFSVMMMPMPKGSDMATLAQGLPGFMNMLPGAG